MQSPSFKFHLLPIEWVYLTFFNPKLGVISILIFKYCFLTRSYVEQSIWNMEQLWITGEREGAVPQTRAVPSAYPSSFPMFAWESWNTVWKSWPVADISKQGPTDQCWAIKIFFISLQQNEKYEEEDNVSFHKAKCNQILKLPFIHRLCMCMY